MYTTLDVPYKQFSSSSFWDLHSFYINSLWKLIFLMWVVLKVKVRDPVIMPNNYSIVFNSFNSFDSLVLESDLPLNWFNPQIPYIEAWILRASSEYTLTYPLKGINSIEVQCLEKHYRRILSDVPNSDTSVKATCNESLRTEGTHIVRCSRFIMGKILWGLCEVLIFTHVEDPDQMITAYCY